jgi:transcriptional regulator with XRE-family HTH domain
MMSYAGNKFRAFRAARGLTQEQVAARKPGLSRTSIAALESGHPVKLETLRLIAEAADLKEREYLSLVTEWIRDLLGEELFDRLSLRQRR